MPAVLLFLFCGAAFGQPMQALFYLTDSAESLRSFYEHARQIDIVVPTWYKTDGTGNVTGGPHPRVLQAARASGVAVMPIVVNPGFRKDIFHALANTAAFRTRLIRSLVAECRRYGYMGIQLDFEGVAAADRSLLTRLVEEASQAFHKAGFRLALAAVPRSRDRPAPTPHSQYTWTNLQGAYDVAKLGAAVDFLTWMTYDQHMRLSTPGPVAGYSWVVEQVDYVLRHVPRGKVSLGIPQYGRRWYSGKGGMEMATIGLNEARALAGAARAQIQWDPRERAPWFSFTRWEAREYVFFNDARAFQERYELAANRGLHSVSVWVLGMEDPDIWKLLKRR